LRIIEIGSEPSFSNLVKEASAFSVCPMNCYTKTTSLFLTREFDFKSRFPVQPINGIGNLWSFSRRERKEFYKKNG
jgi:hypothetical protein